MSPRYYLITTLLVVGLTFGISIWKQMRSGREILLVFCGVVAALVLIVVTILGLAKLLETLGVAESGFIL